MTRATLQYLILALVNSLIAVVCFAYPVVAHKTDLFWLTGIPGLAGLALGVKAWVGLVIDDKGPQAGEFWLSLLWLPLLWLSLASRQWFGHHR